MTVQQHYDRLNGEFDNGVEVKGITTAYIELDLGNSVRFDEVESIVSSAMETLEDVGYSIDNVPKVFPGYRGACDEALLVLVEIEENLYDQGIADIEDS